MMKNAKGVILASVLSLGALTSCNRADETLQDNEQSVAIEQPSIYDKICSYVDANWPSSATLSTTLTAAAGTSSDATLMYNQNTALVTFWRGAYASVPTLRFVRNGSDWNSTYNAISYSTGKIYFGEGIFRDAKSRDYTNLVNVMILAHEYGHQLQYAYGLPSKVESTARAGELEADGMAGYYLRRGYGKSTFTSISTAYNFAYEIGDYYTTDPGHHGTPPQRRSAVRLGFLLADPTNSKLSPSNFDYYFFYYYSGVLNGTYKMVKPNDIPQETHDLVMSHMDELRKIYKGEMSDTEFFNLK